MVSFAQPLFWQVRYLITGLSKKNYKSAVSELHQLVNLYGYDAQVFMLRTLLEEIQLHDVKHGSGGTGRDQLKIQLLQNELKELENEEHFGVILLQAVESSRDGGLQEELASHLCKVSKVQLQAQLALGAACLQSAHETTRREGARFLRAKLKEYMALGGKGPKLPEPMLHAILAALRGPELEEAMEDRDRDTTFKQLIDQHPDVDTSRSPCAGLVHLQRMSPARLARHEKRAVVAELQILCCGDGDGEGIRACDIIEEVGRGAGAASLQAVRDAVSLFPGLGTRGLAEIVCMLVRTSGAPQDANTGFAAGIFSASVRDTWNDPSASAFPQLEGDRNGDGSGDVASVIEVLKECVPNANWLEVFDLLFDLADFRLDDKRGFHALLAAHRAARGAGEAFPLAAVLRRRQNTAAQMHFLRFAVTAEPAALSFAAVPYTLLEPVPGLPGAEDASTIGGPNQCWACHALVERLFELAEVEDYGAVRALFEAPMESCPEVLLLTICLADDRSRGALRAELLEKLAPPLFDDGNPNATAVQATLAERAPLQLKRLLRSFHEKDPRRSLPKIMDSLQKDELVSFYAALLNGPPTELSCQLALLADSREALHLAPWLRETLAEHRDAAALGFIRFLKVRLQPALGPGKDDASRSGGGAGAPYTPPGVDEATLCKSFLDALHEAAPTLAPEAQRQVRELAHVVHQRFPALAPAPPVEAPPGPAPAPPPPSAPATAAAPAVSAAPVASPPPSGPPAPPPTEPPPPPQTGVTSDELEELSNSYFSKIYTEELSIMQLIDILKEFSEEAEGTGKFELFNRMIQNLFDECRFFPKYPEEELVKTGELLGALIEHDLVVGTNLGMALRCVLESLRRPLNSKIFKFGILALEQFLSKLPVCPQLCRHLTQIDHLCEAYPAYADYARNVLKALPDDLQNSTALKPEILTKYRMPRPPPKADSHDFLATFDELRLLQPPPPPEAPPPPSAPPAAAVQPPPQPQPQPQQQQHQRPPPAVGAGSPPPTGPPPPPAGMPPEATPPPGVSGASSLRAAGDSVLLPASPGGAAKGPNEPRQEAIGRNKVAGPAAAAAPGPSAGPASPAANGAAAASANPAAAAVGGTLMFGSSITVDTLLNDPELSIDKPPVWVCDMIAAIFNSLVKDNIDQKAEELASVVQAEHYPWLAYYLVKSRASKEVNFHTTYIEFFEKLKQPRLMELVTNTTYDCLRVLLKSVDQAVVSTSHRTVLKNLGYWLGQITLARNKPLKSKQMDLKSALLDAYENGRLTAVLPLVCKVLEGVQKSKVYKLPNPYTTAIMSLLAEIHDVPNLRTNLMFEVEVLCKHLDIKISDLKRSELLVGKRPPPNSNDLSNAARQAPAENRGEGGSASGSTYSGGKAPEAQSQVAAGAGGGVLRGEAAGKEQEEPSRGTAAAAAAATAHGGQMGQGGYSYASQDPSYSIVSGGMPDRPSATAAQHQHPQQQQQQQQQAAAAATGQSHSDDFINPQLPNLVTINPSIPLFQVQPQLTRFVTHAVDRAIREVISAVVERSVTISCLTTREMVTKDFAMEPDENVLKKAAQLMVSSVAGSLALVTCREPLRVSLTNHLWALLVQHCPTDDQQKMHALEQVVHMLSTENLDRGCNLIQKAVVDKALKDIEESIAPALQARREHLRRGSSVPYYDTSYWRPGEKWPAALPDVLRPKPGPMPAQQLKVYKDFNQVPIGTVKVREAAAMAAAAAAANALGMDGAAAAHSVAAAVMGHHVGRGYQGYDVEHRAEDYGVPDDGPRGMELEIASSLVPAPVPHDAQAALANLCAQMDQVVIRILANPPLLPPIDCQNPHLYRQDDALDACTALGMLSLDHELVQLLRQVPHWLSVAPHAESCALELAQRLFRRLYEAPQAVPQVHPPDTVSLLHVVIEVYLAVLDTLRDTLKEQFPKVLITWVNDVQGVQRFNVDVIAGMLRYHLLNPPEFDRLLAKWVDGHHQTMAMGGINALALDFAVMLLQRLCLRQRVFSGPDFVHALEALMRECQRNRQPYQQTMQLLPHEMQLIESAIKLLEDLRGAEVLPHGAPRQAINVRFAERQDEESRNRLGAANLANSKDAVVALFEEWYNIYNASSDSLQSRTGRTGSQVFQEVLRHILGIIRTDDAKERFFRVCCEHAVQRTFADPGPVGSDREDEQRDRSEPDASPDGQGESGVIHFSAIDAFTRLVVLLMKYTDRVSILTRALTAIARELIRDCERRGVTFNQRPYFRILLNLLMDVSAPDPVLEQDNFKLLSAFCNTFHMCNPMRVPNFAFAWVELISNRMFMPKLLMVKNQKGWIMFQRLLVQLLYFLEPYLRRVQLNDSLRLLYKGTVRMLLVLLHDFPEFLCDYHFSFCDIMPIPCVQIRNLILSAFPRNMKLPDPFMPNLKVDLLPEIKVAPRILANYTTTLLQLHLKHDVDQYMRNRERRLLEVIKDKLRLPKREALQLDTKYNVPLLNALLLYVGVHLPQQGKTGPQQGLQQNNPSLEIFMYLAHHFDYEGRYLFLGAIANHLRYPNTHTHYFSCVLLYLFAETPDEVVREQITRVLLERLIVHRPHPWGLLITFIELIKNRRYEFWQHSFVKCAPEVEKLFQSVAYTCLGTTIDRQSETDFGAAETGPPAGPPPPPSGH